MHSPITFPYVSMTVHHHYSPILGQKESKAGLALDLPRSWSQYPKVRVALSESQALPLTLGSPLLYFLPWDVPQWTLTPTSMATVTFPRVRGLYGLSHYFLVFPRHLLSFQGKVGEDMRKAGEVQVELGFQVQLPEDPLLLGLLWLCSFILSLIGFATCHLGLPLFPGQQPMFHIHADGLEHGEVVVEIGSPCLGLASMNTQLHIPQKAGDHHQLFHVAHHGRVLVHDSQQAVPAVALGQHLHGGFSFHTEAGRLPQHYFQAVIFVWMHSSLTECKAQLVGQHSPLLGQSQGLGPNICIRRSICPGIELPDFCQSFQYSVTASARAWLLLHQLTGSVRGRPFPLATGALETRAVINSFRSPETKLPLGCLCPNAQLTSSTWVSQL